LAERGIATRPGTHAVHSLKYYREKYGISPEDFPNSWIAAECSAALPLYPGLTAEDMEYILDAVRAFGRERLS
ncbi:DegT/DnrJ/EryC1/StrS family aminotransferase, partial [bacterium]|nr:DegT/DnrJ/EryC1/StrS family aminotransferase [bacterium]